MFLFVVTCIVAQNVNSQWEKVDGNDVVGGVLCYVLTASTNCTVYGTTDCTNRNAHVGTLGNCSYNAQTNEYTCPWTGVDKQNATSYIADIFPVELLIGAVGYDKLDRKCKQRILCNLNGECTVHSLNGVTYGYCKNSNDPPTFGDTHDHYSIDGYGSCQ
jgi:hypothetical protein